VPLLLAHSVYKFYPASFLAQNRWKEMSAWLDTVTYGDVRAVEVSGCSDVDEWLDRLDKGGLHTVVSSGTSGKNSFLIMDDVDLDMILRLQGAFVRVPVPDRASQRPPGDDHGAGVGADANWQMLFSTRCDP